MSKHTPGPWAINLGQLHGHGNRIGSIDDADTNAGLTDEEAHANAALITAAPDLLAHLQFAVKLLDGIPAISATAQVDAMRSAIARATGDGL